MPDALIYSLLLAAIVLGLATVAVFRADRLAAPVRFLVALVFAPLACFCVFGFLAAFEPGPGHIVWRWLYAVTFLACVAALVRLAVVQRDGTPRDRVGND